MKKKEVIMPTWKNVIGNEWLDLTILSAPSPSPPLGLLAALAATIADDTLHLFQLPSQLRTRAVKGLFQVHIARALQEQVSFSNFLTFWVTQAFLRHEREEALEGSIVFIGCVLYGEHHVEDEDYLRVSPSS
ncbi:hypothetical protein Syun_017079 [Stephania yunnanensis]|uniref:Uncharacterized protein n=1 Tax=Stephania yunnanensis TaxID=152371 RepID=A0AAP0J8L5_9MAGN